MSIQVNIIGAFHSRFGNHEEEDLYSLYTECLSGAIEDAQVKAKDIDAVFVGNYSGGGFNQQENIAPYGINIIPELRFKPLYRVETACTSSSSAIHMAIMAIKSGEINRAAVVGLEKMNSQSTKEVSRILSQATYWPDEGEKGVNAPCMFADLAKGWMKKYGFNEERLHDWLAEIAAKAYANGEKNPVAHIRKARSKEEILALPNEKNPVINDPLRLHDCSLISDGSAALILEAADLTRREDAVRIKSFFNASDYLDSFGKNKSDHYLEGAAVAIKKVLNDAGMSINNIQMAEVHDCFTITELLIYSALGLTRPGREFEALEDKIVYPQGKLVINSSGGLKSKGHPIGATGVAMHAHIYKQLTEDPYGINISNAEAGLVLNIGGSGTSNCASVLLRQ